MKKIVTAIVIFFLSSVSFADDQERELDKLFLELKKNIPSKSSNIEQQIWLLWSTHPSDEKLTSISHLNKGIYILKSESKTQKIKLN